MEIVYKNNKLKKQCESLKEAKKDYGFDIAKKIKKDINFIESAQDLSTVINYLPFHFHDLKGDLSGKYSIDVAGRRNPYRFIVQFDGYDKDMVFKNPSCIKIISIEKISDHYKKG
ncbi:type II toxin-antitoxin system RelE/ParE family toxin [Nicoliella spurrieriana]|uniref:Type II toxin-antitoxin system RelE/ParE family toxin n=1 Tax=Nicoliella spurrieriana TaxID=2925830 RepID=A0A976RS32_9LACO|nr:type II toxin-antitoxin system RelE/ParE family toxin [Nicoliella spurrieriana]UQS86855.1 type II toxin-antitoxin system RelE/ParE family toxin [Nicoliella spurrieriana]